MTAPTLTSALSPILLIEDEPSVSAFVRAALEPLPYDLDIPMIGNAKHSEASAKDGVQKPIEGKLGR